MTPGFPTVIRGVSRLTILPTKIKPILFSGCIPGEPRFLLFSDRRSIQRMQLKSAERAQLFSGNLPGSSIVALDFLAKSGAIFWTDVARDAIYRAHLNRFRYIDSPPKAVITEGLQSPDGLAVDWINDKLYWTDSATKLIEVSDLNGSHRLQLISTGLSKPRAIVVTPLLGYVSL